MIRRDTLVFQTLVAIAQLRGGTDPNRCEVTFEVLVAGYLARAAIRRQMAMDRLSELSFQVLAVLFAIEPDPVTPADLAYHIGASRGTAAKVLHVLERRRLVVRRVDPRDRRTVGVRLTEAGRRLADSSLAAHVRLMDRLARHVNLSAKPALIEACAKLEAAAEGYLSRPVPL